MPPPLIFAAPKLDGLDVEPQVELVLYIGYPLVNPELTVFAKLDADTPCLEPPPLLH